MFGRIVAACVAAAFSVSGAVAAGNIVSKPTYLKSTIKGAENAMTGTDFQLETGKFYIWEIESDGVLETLIQAPELFRNSWLDQIVINDKEIHASGGFYGVEYDGAGTIAIGFVPIRPGDYPMFSPGFEDKGFKGTFHVAGDSLSSGATAIDLNIDTAKLAFSTNDIPLETGKAYRLNVTSDGLEELGVQAPDLWANSWINQFVVDDLEVKLTGAPYSIEYDDEGTISVSFVPLRPGNYKFYAPGYEERGLSGTFTVR